jgi:hypothetical protein
MAFGFKYHVSLLLTHPSMDARRISERLHPLEATKAITAGQNRIFKSGRQRPASVTVWEARLHNENELDSEELSLSDFLKASLPRLEEFKDFFAEVRQNGDARLEVVWYTESTHSAGVVEPEVLMKLGNMQLSFDLEHYCREQTKGEQTKMPGTDSALF